MSEKIEIHKVSLEKRKQYIAKWPIPEQERVALIRLLII